MMRTRPALGDVFSGGALRRVIGVTSDSANSDMDCLPGGDQWEIQGEGGAFAGAALHADIARMFLDDAVSDGQPETGAASLAIRGRRFGGEKWIVDALNVFLRNARAGIGDAHADEFAVHGRHLQYSAAGH